MKDNFTGKKLTKPALKRCIWPSPIVHATLDTGETINFSYWCPLKADTQEMLARGKFSLDWILKYGAGQWPEYKGYNGAKLIRLYVEDRRIPGQPWDIYEPEAAQAPTRKRTTVKEVKSVLADVLKLIPHTEGPAIERAQELLAA